MSVKNIKQKCLQLYDNALWKSLQGLGFVAGIMLITHYKRSELRKKVHKKYKTVVKKGFWGTTTYYIERDKPLP